MRSTALRLPLLALVLSLAGKPLHAEPLRVEPVVVTEPPLRSSAEGTTEITLPEITPATTQSLSFVTERVANLHLSASGAGMFGAPLSLRGLSNTPYFSDPAVAVYFGDIPLGHAFTFPTTLFGFSRVVLERGPQPAGGRTGEGGTLRFDMPDGADAAGEVRAGFGNADLRSAALSFQTARMPKTDARVAAAYQRRDGFVTNTTLGRTVDDQEVSSAAARVRFRPTDRTEIALQLLAHRHRDGAQPLVPLAGPHYSVNRGREGRTNSDFVGAALRLAADTSVGRFTSVTSTTNWALDPFENRLVLPPTLDSHLTQRQRAWNEEFGLVPTPYDGQRWRVGGWLSDVTTTGDVNRAIPGLFPIEASRFTTTARTAAAFGAWEWSATEALRISAALRAETVRKEFDRSQQVPSAGRFTARDTFDQLLPKLTVSYAFARGTHATAAVSQGTKPGGWSAYTDKPQLAGFAAEKTTAFEVGIDTALPARHLQVAVRFFDYEIRNDQIERSFTATDYLVVNAPRARAAGGEWEATWRPGASWTVTLAAGVTDVTLREFVDPFSKVSYRGKRAPYAPDWDGHLAVAHRFTPRWFITGTLVGTGRTYFDESEDPRFMSSAHVLLNAECGYDAPRWRLVVHVENVGDVSTTTLIVPGVGHAVPGAPRTYGLEFTAKW